MITYPIVSAVPNLTIISTHGLPVK